MELGQVRELLFLNVEKFFEVKLREGRANVFFRALF